MPNNRIYKIRQGGQPIDGYGPYRKDEVLVQDLETLLKSQRQGERLVVHVYRIRVLSSGFDRKYLGQMSSEDVVAAGAAENPKIRQTFGDGR